MPFMRRRVLIVMGAALIALAAACGEERLGAPPVFTASISAPAVALTSGAEATWTVTIAGGTAPFSVVWDFGSGATPATVTTTTSQAGVASTATVKVWEGAWTASVSVTDAKGHVARDSMAYVVDPAL